MASYFSFTFHCLILNFIKFSPGFCAFPLQFSATHFSLSTAAETLKKHVFFKQNQIEEDSSLVIKKNDFI